MRLPFSSKVHLPPTPTPILSNVPGIWAFDTMSRRIKDEIYPRIIQDNENELTYPSSPLRSECLLVLNDLLSSLEAKSTGYLRGIVDSGPDIATWDSILSTLNDSERNWLDSPWLISEFYFYRRITEAFRYFETGYDFFAAQKASGLMSTASNIEQLAATLPFVYTQDARTMVETGCLSSLWGNRLDLSLWPGSANAGMIAISQSKQQLVEAQAALLDNHLSQVTDHLVNSSPGRVDIIVDNAGYELVTDLVLARLLLQSGVTEQIVLHTKGHPTFVSDATNMDCLETIEWMATSPTSDHPATAALGEALREDLQLGRIVLRSDLFWCQPLAFWDMPDDIAKLLSDSKLAIVKGDANYRRLLGDRYWPLETPATALFSYMPCPTLALRSLKAELGCGISAEQQQRAQEKDTKWMVSGKWGVLQFCNPKLL